MKEKDLIVLAETEARRLCKDGVTSAVVIVGNANGDMGIFCNAPNFSLDTVIGSICELLGSLRKSQRK